MTRVVVDTNALVSALVRGGKPRTLVLKLLEDHSVLLCVEMFAELVDFLSRQKFAFVKRSQIDTFLSKLVRGCEVMAVTSHLEVVKEDQDDNTVLATGHDGKAEYIVTGDKHLLALGQFRGIHIVKVNEMLDILSRSSRA